MSKKGKVKRRDIPRVIHAIDHTFREKTICGLNVSEFYNTCDETMFKDKVKIDDIPSEHPCCQRCKFLYLQRVEESRKSTLRVLNTRNAKGPVYRNQYDNKRN